jgi:hypothetical protein
MILEQPDSFIKICNAYLRIVALKWKRKGMLRELSSAYRAK